MRTGSIYIIKNNVNKKVYIGQTTMTVHERFMAHMKPSTAKKRGTYKLYNAINKYGKENFFVETLESNIPLEELDSKEIKYIKEYNSYQNGYNSTPGGDGRIINLLNDEEKVLNDAKKGKPATEIADEYGVNVATIYRTLHKLKFYYPETDNDSIISDIKNGALSRKDIAKKYEVDVKTIYRIAKKNNLPVYEKIEETSSFNLDKFINDYYNAKTKTDICSMYGITPAVLKRLVKKYKLPNIEDRISKHRIGETKKMSNGEVAKIIEYRNATDIDVEFFDGTIVSNTSYYLFINNKINKPVDYTTRIGETRIMNCGMKAEIINYKEYKDIDVKFEDGTIVRHKQYISFLSGNIKNPSIKYEGKKKLRLNETKLMNDGRRAKIIEYVDSRNIIVQFEDGTQKKCTYRTFSEGNVFIRGKNTQKHIGKTRLMNCGMTAKIIEYINPENITIQFEDGTILNNIKMGSFSRGRAKNPNIKNNKLGETRLMNCGMQARIVQYHSYNNIDVMFDDGFLVSKTSYSSFLKGTIKNKNIIKNIDRLGETRMMNCGMTAKIIEYVDSRNIIVQFEDGTISKGIRYQDYKNGNVRNENRYKNRIGMCNMMNCGMTAKIIDYRSAKDIDVQFEDGMVIKHRQYTDFKKGEISNFKKRK